MASLAIVPVGTGDLSPSKIIGYSTPGCQPGFLPDPMRRFAREYRDFFRLPDVAALMAVALAARMPIGMVGLSMLMFLRESLGSYALAGAASGVYFVAMAVGAPVQGRLIDRRGPKDVLVATGIVSPLALLAVLLLGRAIHFREPALQGLHFISGRDRLRPGCFRGLTELGGVLLHRGQLRPQRVPFLREPVRIGREIAHPAVQLLQFAGRHGILGRLAAEQCAIGVRQRAVGLAGKLQLLGQLGDLLGGALLVGRQLQLQLPGPVLQRLHLQPHRGSIGQRPGRERLRGERRGGFLPGNRQILFQGIHLRLHAGESLLTRFKRAGRGGELRGQLAHRVVVGPGCGAGRQLPVLLGQPGHIGAQPLAHSPALCQFRLQGLQPVDRGLAARPGGSQRRVLALQDFVTVRKFGQSSCLIFARRLRFQQGLLCGGQLLPEPTELGLRAALGGLQLSAQTLNLPAQGCVACLLVAKRALHPAQLRGQLCVLGFSRFGASAQFAGGLGQFSLRVTQGFFQGLHAHTRYFRSGAVAAQRGVFLLKRLHAGGEGRQIRRLIPARALNRRDRLLCRSQLVAQAVQLHGRIALRRLELHAQLLGFAPGRNHLGLGLREFGLQAVAFGLRLLALLGAHLRPCLQLAGRGRQILFGARQGVLGLGQLGGRVSGRLLRGRQLLPGLVKLLFQRGQFPLPPFLLGPQAGIVTARGGQPLLKLHALDPQRGEVRRGGRKLLAQGLQGRGVRARGRLLQTAVFVRQAGGGGPFLVELPLQGGQPGIFAAGRGTAGRNPLLRQTQAAVKVGQLDGGALDLVVEPGVFRGEKLRAFVAARRGRSRQTGEPPVFILQPGAGRAQAL